jgi:glutathione S-transferase
MKLYNSNYSPNAKRIRIAANELGSKLEIEELDFAKGENRQPGYVAMNPMGKIPTFEDDGYVLWESPAILHYLANKHGKLVPRDLKQSTEMYRWMFWNASHYEGALFALVFENVIKPQMMKQEADPKRVESSKKDFERFAPVFNAHLEGKQFVCGNDFTIADIAIGCTSELAPMVGIDLKQYTHINAWLTRLQARPSWK